MTGASRSSLGRVAVAQPWQQRHQHPRQQLPRPNAASVRSCLDLHRRRVTDQLGAGRGAARRGELVGFSAVDEPPPHSRPREQRAVGPPDTGCGKSGIALAPVGDRGPPHPDLPRDPRRADVVALVDVHANTLLCSHWKSTCELGLKVFTNLATVVAADRPARR